MLLVLRKATLAKSAAEMAAMANATSRAPVTLPGALGLHEESAQTRVGPACDFLSQRASE